jgi:hypothetical protein
MLTKTQDDDLFGNDSDSDFEDEMKNKMEQNILYNESDVDEKETFPDSDYFTNDNEEYKKSSPFPIVKCPDEKYLDNYE